MVSTLRLNKFGECECGRCTERREKKRRVKRHEVRVQGFIHTGATPAVGDYDGWEAYREAKRRLEACVRVK